MQKAEVRRFASAIEGAARMLRTGAVTGDLSLPASSVLGRLLIEGPQRLTTLAVAERVSQPAMTQLVARLERDKLVRKRPDGSDARAVLVEITAAGRLLVEKRRQERAEFIGGILSRLDDAARAELAAALPALEMLVRAHQAPCLAAARGGGGRMTATGGGEHAPRTLGAEALLKIGESRD